MDLYIKRFKDRKQIERLKVGGKKKKKIESRWKDINYI